MVRASAPSLSISTASASASAATAPHEKRIRVCVRLRPFTRSEAVKSGGKAAWTWHENTIYQQIFPAQAHSQAQLRRQQHQQNQHQQQHHHHRGGPGNQRGSPATQRRTESPPSRPNRGTSSGNLPSSYSFDYLYGPSARTRQLYDDSVHDAIVAAVDGYHSSVFLYGQTGTGKTHTMLGSRQDPGLLQLAIDNLFQVISQRHDSEFLLRFSYLEIYNERVYDLLASGERTDIKIFEVERPNNGDAYVCNDVVIKGVAEEIVTTADHVLSLVEAGNFHRHTARTDANEQSSRSHVIFRLVIESQDAEGDEDEDNHNEGVPRSNNKVRSATLNLVDLAGSESVRLANTSGQHLEEGRFINRSLLTLGHIIWKLSRGRPSSSSSSAWSPRSAGSAPITPPGPGQPQQPPQTPQHLPYRNSKLTRILQPALGGKAQITIICTVAPSVECLAETHNTLKFATRARRVKSRLAISETSGESALLRKYRARIKQLEEQWDELERRKSESSTPLSTTSSKRALMAIEERQNELRFAIENINRVILNSSHRQGGESVDNLSVRTEDEPAEPVVLNDPPMMDEPNQDEEHVDTSEPQPQDDGDEEEEDIDPADESDEPSKPQLLLKQSTSTVESDISGSPEPEDELSVGTPQRKMSNASSTKSARRGPTLTTVLKAKFTKELKQAEEAAASPSGSSSRYRELLHEFVRGLEIAENENDTRITQIHDLERENRDLRDLLNEREAELKALRSSALPPLPQHQRMMTPRRTVRTPNAGARRQVNV
ncbi:hypothetical protein Poli38472_014143 [Pythium oligandrum]|uniref:Kinesin-like protein n=1 Tax=Pythium oligandrum TaxID=41045 RepID=A0A8K1CI60_PYTOL|nr:hypothetical protein Poli38472_014143 [Pythium oligandrum]|eukprot:TMW64026.1 hypothetical protein Poli38472_014143 [Pythium oligandrum]